jgi:hypothetical protein
MKYSIITYWCLLNTNSALGIGVTLGRLPAHRDYESLGIECIALLITHQCTEHHGKISQECHWKPGHLHTVCLKPCLSFQWLLCLPCRGICWVNKPIICLYCTEFYMFSYFLLEDKGCSHRVEPGFMLSMQVPFTSQPK